MRPLSYRVNSQRIPIFIDETHESLIAHLKTVQKGGVVIDSKVAKAHDDLRAHLERMDKMSISYFEAKEENKNLEHLSILLTALLKKNIERDQILFAIGGGVTGDIAGFAAAIYKRGIAYIQVPTTLLSMVDSSIGGKVGINHPLGKNMIGAFHQPIAVLISLKFLETLPEKELVCGLGEIAKYAILRGDQFFDYLQSHTRQVFERNKPLLIKIIKTSIDTKKRYIERDVYENGIRAHLNLGHTIGHAIETATGYSVFKHGEAVLLGILAEAHIAMRMKLLKASSFEKILKLIRQLMSESNASINLDETIHSVLYDKKAKEGRVRFVLPTSIGSVTIRDDVTPRNISDAMKFVASENLFVLS
ncbi:MAG: 3-dehydroquinate synthase [Candidatus Kryptoniota bacterium]